MKVSDKPTKNISLEELTEALTHLDREAYPDYTADWPRDELKAAIQKGIESGDSGISSIEDYYAYLARKKK